jgi:Leu/Phe-tRNA-protein transferase
MDLGRAVVVACALAAVAIMAYNGTWLKSGFAQLFVVILALGIAAGVTFFYARKVGG